MSTDQRGQKILARTFYNHLRSEHYDAKVIIGIATELIDLVASELQNGTAAASEEMPELTPAPPLVVHQRPPAA